VCKEDIHIKTTKIFKRWYGLLTMLRPSAPRSRKSMPVLSEQDDEGVGGDIQLEV
jgi:hypothetical protein